MSTIEAGTRRWANTQLGVRLSTRKFDRTYTRDTGLAENVTGALQFNAGAAQVALAGQLGAFGFNDDVLIGGTVNNNGLFKVTSTGSGTLGLDPPPVTEIAPVTATMRIA